MKTTQEYQKRLQRHLDELKWLYCELYPGREDMFGMMLYIDAFAGNLKGVKKKLPYLEACNVNYLHLMPFQDLLGKGECVLRNINLLGNGYGWYYKTWEE